jgi:hypothetical protein
MYKPEDAVALEVPPFSCPLEAPFYSNKLINKKTLSSLHEIYNQKRHQDHSTFLLDLEWTLLAISVTCTTVLLSALLVLGTAAALPSEGCKETFPTIHI